MTAQRSACPWRVAVVCEGDPSDPAEWSGTPHGVMSGLRECGVEAIPVRGAPRGLLAKVGQAAVGVVKTRPASFAPTDVLQAARRGRHTAIYTATYGSLCTLYARAGLRRVGAVDGVIQIGSSYVVRHPNRVTFEDMTVRQAAQYGQYTFDEVAQAELEARIRRQRRAYTSAVAVLTATPWAASSVVDEYGVEAAKVRAVGLGRNHSALPDPDKDWSVPRFLFVGNDWTRKNGDAVVSAFTRLRARYPEATLDVVGRHPRLDVEGVRTHGYLSLSEPAASRRLDDLFRASTCLVVPSIFEAAGIVYVEAAAAGMACIGTTRGGARDMVGPAGLTVDPTRPDQLDEAMGTMAVGDVAREYATAGLARAEEFTWTCVAARMLAALGLMQWAEPVSW